MKGHNSQQGSENKVGKSREEVKRKKGHMALKNNVWTIRGLLWKELKPLELCCLDLIIDRTIGWRQSEAAIKIEHFVEFTGQVATHVYSALRVLKRKQIILYHRNQHWSYYALNSAYFGDLLIARHEKAYQERRSRITLAVNNEKNSDETSDEIGHNDRRNSSQEQTKLVSESNEIRQSNVTQNNEIIEEKGSLKTLFKDILINTSLKSGEGEPKAGKIDFSLLGKKKPKPKQCENPEDEKQRQLAEARAAGIL